MSMPWHDCQGAVPTGNDGYSLLRYQTEGFAADLEVPPAYIKVDYYVTFRG